MWGKPIVSRNKEVIRTKDTNVNAVCYPGTPRIRGRSLHSIVNTLMRRNQGKEEEGVTSCLEGWQEDFQKKVAIRLRFKAGMHYSEVRVTNQLRGLWQGSEWTETVKGVKACGRVGEAVGKRNSRQVSIRKPKAGTICLKHFLVFSSCMIHFSFFFFFFWLVFHSTLMQKNILWLDLQHRIHYLPGTEVCI